MKAEGVTSVRASSSARACRERRHRLGHRNHRAEKMMAECDAVVLCGGAEQPADLPVRARSRRCALRDGVLPLQNKRVAGDSGVRGLWASGKHVVVIGGGDTGSDCVGTSNRHVSKNRSRSSSCSPSRLIRLITPVWPNWRSGYAPLPLTGGCTAAIGRSHERVRRENGKVKC